MLLRAALGTSAVGKANSGGSPGEVRGLAHVTLAQGTGLVWAAPKTLNCSLPFGCLQRRQSQALLEDAQGKDRSQWS